MKRILLSVPHMGGTRTNLRPQAFASNWLSTVGPNITAFEREFEARIGLPSVALGSGTAAIHLGLRLLGVGPGDEVFCSTLTFVASCNPVRYLGAEPVFLDSDSPTWNLDPNILEDALRQRAQPQETAPRPRRGAPLRPVRRHGSDPGDLPRLRSAGARRRRRSPRRHLPQPAGRNARRHRGVLVQRQ